MSAAKDTTISVPDSGIFDCKRLISTEEKEIRFEKLLLLLHTNDVEVKKKSLKALRFLCGDFKPTGDSLESLKKYCETTFLRDMEDLIEKRLSLWAEMWQFCVKVVGCDLHNARTLLNGFLSVIEKALKKKDSTDTIVMAFQCWSVLIDNFALKPDLLASPRRIGLILTPLKSKTAKDVASWKAKFYTWWHLIVNLKSAVTIHFTTVIKPFFKFCFPETMTPEGQLIKLCHKSPSLTPIVSKALAVILGTGLPGIEEQLLMPQDGFELPIVPIIQNSKYFEEIYKESISAVFYFLKIVPNDEHANISFMALATRVEMVLSDNEYQGSTEAMHELLICTKELITSKMLHPQSEVNLVDLLHKLVQSLFAVWNVATWGTPIRSLSCTPREFLFDLMVEQMSQLTTDTTFTVEKREERFIKMLGKLMEYPETLVAGPQHCSALKKLTQALENAIVVADTRKVNKDQAFLIKLLSVWDQVSKLVAKSIPSESANEECNSLSKNSFLDMMLLPLKWLIEYDANAYNLNIEKLMSNWKPLLQKYIEVSKLSLSVNKQHPFSEISDKILKLLSEKTCQASTVAAVMHVCSQFVAFRNNPSTTLTFHEDGLSEVPLMYKLTEMLSQQVVADDPRTGKVARRLAKCLQSLMITQNNLVFLLGIFKVFFSLLMIPLEHLHAKDEHLAEVWKLYAHHFTGVLNKREPGVDSRETKMMLKEILPNLIQLKLHKNIKVQQGAMQLEDTFNNCIHKTNQRAAAIKTDEQKPTSPRGFVSPAQSVLSFKRGRKSLQSTNTSTPGSPTTKNKPVLEDQDSQDFVKIPPKPKTKKVLTSHQKESKRRRREDIPALYQGLSQDTFNSDTQDTQDSPMDVVPTASSSDISLLFFEDASDVIINPDKQSASNTTVTTVSEVLRPILEPIQVESKANKNSQDTNDDVMLDIAPLPPVNKKNENIVTNETSKENVKSDKKDTVSVESPAKTVPPQIDSIHSNDDDVVFIEETSPSKKQLITEKEEAVSMKENLQATPPQLSETQDTQDNEIVENSQNAFNIVTTSNQLTADKTKGTTVLPVVKFTRLRNRQGVTLQTRSPKIPDTTNKEKVLPSRNLSGRAAQLLGMVQSNKDTTQSHDGNVLMTTEPKKMLPSTEAISETKDITAKPATTISSSELLNALPPGIIIQPLSSTSTLKKEVPLSAEESPSKSVIRPEECSPDKSFSLVYVPTPPGPTSISKRSNLKRNISDAANKDDVQTPSPKKLKRVSFAEPIVSGALESPEILSEQSTFNSLYRNNSPKSVKKKENRVSRKLLLVAATNANYREQDGCLKTTITTLMSETSQGTVTLEESVDHDALVFPPLISCKAPVELIASKLSSPMLCTALIESLKNSNIHTIGDLCNLKEILVKNLEIKEPKLQNLKIAISEYAANSNEEIETDSSEPMLLSETTVPVETDVQSDSVPVVQDPDEAENSLKKQLEMLVQQHSLQEVLNALGLPDESRSAFDRLTGVSVTSELKNSLASQNVPKVSPTVDLNGEVCEQIFRTSARTELLAKLATSLTPTETIEILKLQNAKLQSCKNTLESKKFPTSKFSSSLNQSKEMLNFIVANADSQKLLESFINSGKKKCIVDFILANPNNMNMIMEEVFNRAELPHVIDALGHKYRVLGHVLTKVSPKEVMKRLLKTNSIPQLMEALGHSKKVLDYVIKKWKPRTIIMKASASMTTGNLLSAVSKRHDLINHCLMHGNKQEIIKNVSNSLSVSDVLNALDKDDEVLAHVLQTLGPKAILSKSATLLSISDILETIEREDEIIDSVIDNTEPVGLVKRASLILKDGDLSKIITTLEPTQQEEVSIALPKEIVCKRVESIMKTGKDDERELLLKEILPNIPCSRIPDIFAHCCTIGEQKNQVLVQIIQKVISELPTELSEQVLNTLLSSETAVVDSNIPLCNLLKILIKKMQVSKDNLDDAEKFLLTDFCSALPLALIIQQVETRLKGTAAVDAADLKNYLVKALPNKVLLEHFLSKFETDEISRDAATRRILETVPVHKTLAVMEDKLQNIKVSKQTLRILQNMFTSFLPQMTIPIKEVLETVEMSDSDKFEVLEHVVSMMQMKDVMNALPLKDVIQYYEKLVVMDECKVPLLRTSLENVTYDDLIRFIGTDKFLQALELQMQSKTPKITPLQVFEKLPSYFVTDSFSNHLSQLPTSEASVELLKTHFPKTLLIKLVSELILPSSS